MSMPLKWEFPGGKINDGESSEECLRRELIEELGVEISVGQALTATTHQYPAFTVTLHPFICKIVSGEITLHEHRAMVWLPVEELRSLDWTEADWSIIEECQRRLKGPGHELERKKSLGGRKIAGKFIIWRK